MKCDSSGVKNDGINYLEPIDQVEILNEQFVSASTKEDNTSVPTMGTSTANTVPPLKVNGVKNCFLVRIHTKLLAQNRSHQDS